MDAWNFRVVCYNAGTPDEHYQICEVHYDEQLRVASIGPVFESKASSVQTLSHQMIHAISAFTKPVLNYEEHTATFTSDSAELAANLLRPKHV